MRVEVSQVIDRPVADVFVWYADEHVRNHPRWDPDIELEATSRDAIQFGSVIRRRNVRYGTPVEGTMEVVEYEPDRAFGVIIKEGSYEMPGRATFEPVSPGRTEITLSTEVSDSLDQDVISSGMQRSARNIKQLIESDL